jgi:hypothetical protein
MAPKRRILGLVALGCALPCLGQALPNFESIQDNSEIRQDLEPVTAPVSWPARPAPAAPAESGCLRRLAGGELGRPLVRVAQRILSENFERPIGTVILFEENGSTFAGRLETHFHPEGGPRRPWGPHKGVTLYAVDHGAAECDPTVRLPADVLTAST